MGLACASRRTALHTILFTVVDGAEGAKLLETERAMIVLTEEQLQQLSEPETAAIDPRTSQEYVVVRKENYERMKELLYDDSPWTDEEMDALAWEAGKHAGWEHMTEYDTPEVP
jgi:hypothetical protein